VSGALAFMLRALLRARNKHVSCVSWRACRTVFNRHGATRHVTSRLSSVLICLGWTACSEAVWRDGPNGIWTYSKIVSLSM